MCFFWVYFLHMLFAHTSLMLDYDHDMSRGVSESDRDSGMCDCSSLKSIIQTLDLI